MAEEVIELSVEETNKLRADLGLKPLRTGRDDNNNNNHNNAGTDNGGDGDDGNEILEMSVSETNKLREKLGLPPLRQDDDDSGSRKKEIHKPAENLTEKDEVAKRIQAAKLKREVEQGASKVFGSSTLASDDDGKTGSWAEKMRQQKEKKKSKKKLKRSSGKDNDDDDNNNNPNTNGGTNTAQSLYGEDDLEGMAVRNNMADIQAGSSTILTLADAEILESNVTTANKVVGLNDQEDELENVNLTELNKQQDGLRKKRMLEMGMGRAGGYAGFDDEEFEELGGTLGPSRHQRGAGVGTNGPNDDNDDGQKRGRNGGFRIGAMSDDTKNDQTTDFDKVQQGKAISLEANADIAGNDYMTLEEEEAERESKKRKKDVKFKKKKKKKKDRRKRRTELDDDDDDDEDDEGPTSAATKRPAYNGTANLLSQLEESADPEQSSGLRKRRKIDDDNDDQNSTLVSGTNGRNGSDKRSQYQKAMEKGNERTREAFNPAALKKPQPAYADEEVDDSFLNAAISKARRLNRLRGMNKAATGADAVAEAVKSSASNEVANTSTESSSSSKISFSIDDTREFSRALRARTQQKERELSVKASIARDNSEEQEKSSQSNDVPDSTVSSGPDVKVEDQSDVEMEDADMEELAKQVDDSNNDPSDFDGSTAASVGVGRGLSSFVSMLKTTGEITAKNGVTEELRGRAKDERNYDIYKPMDLSQVVAIGKNATDKDVELANREIKLEYRDKHGRLLTQKDAYRELCYQFHGHGASKKKEEKRLQQIAREQAEARLASKQVSAARDGKSAGTTLGALKATQEATGKAYIVHKT